MLSYHAWDAVRVAGAAVLIPLYLKNNRSSGQLVNDSKYKTSRLM